MKFPQLLESIASIPSLKRIRFMTSHPKDFSSDLINVINNHENIARHIHLPVQSGSTEIIKKMNRHYTKESYIKLANDIRSKIKDVVISTDLIVGFPGETEDNFQDTIDLYKQVQFESAFTFLYSKRDGTPAASYPNQVPEDIANDRFTRLLNVVKEISQISSKKYINSLQEVLVEEEDVKAGFLTGRCSNNYLVHFPGSKELIGKFVKVRLLESKDFYFYGEIEK